MEDLLVALLCLAVVWLLIRQHGRRKRDRLVDNLSDSIASLDRRLALLEQANRPIAPPASPPHYMNFQSAAVVTPPPAAPSAPTSQPLYETAPPPAPAAEVAARPYAAPQPASARPTWPPPPSLEAPPPSFAAEPKRRVSIEERLGQNWLNKLGIVTLVIGLALFLGYQLRALGPAGKSAIGFVLSLALLGGGLVLERRSNYRIFARAAIGGGWALTFFVTFAIYHVDAMKVLDSQAADLVLMFLVAAAMVIHSLHYKSQVVTSLAFLLAFVTVGISDVTPFSLVAGALLAAGLIYVAAREYWYWLGLCGLIGVYLNHFLWLYRVLPNGATPGHPFAQFLPSAALLLLYWLLFRLFYVLRVPKSHEQSIVASITAILNSVGVMSLLKFQSSHPEWAFWGLLVLGAAEMLLAFVARRRVHTAFIVLSSIASVLLIAAIPFHFSGSSWTFFWLLEAEVLFLVGVRLQEQIFRRLGMLAGFAVAVKLIVIEAATIFELRQDHPDTGHHLAVALTFLCAAVLLWLNAELAPRRWSFVADEDFDRASLTATTYIAAAMALLGVWVLIPGLWTVVAWLVLALVLGWMADKAVSNSFAAQTDLVAVCAVVRVVVVNLQSEEHLGRMSLRAITVTLAAALLYLNMRRREVPLGFTANYVPASYSWVAAALIGTLFWYELQPIAVAVAWGVFGLVLFELGHNLRRGYLRHQAYALLAASFVRIFFANLNVSSAHLLSARLYTVVPLIAAYFWVYERGTAESAQSKFDRLAAMAAAWAGTVATAALMYFEVRAAWVAIAWAVLALVLIAVGLALRRTLLVAQSLVVLLAAAIRALMFNVFSAPPLATTRITSRVFCVGVTSALMLAVLPIAFRVRRWCADREADNALRLMLYRPEQPFFFVPVVLLATLLAVQLRAGMITVGWSVLGVLVFLLALAVKERSYRLAGLSLLMLGVLKILCVDIWQANSTDRYITLIVMGAALLLVSFLYSRYRESLLKFL